LLTEPEIGISILSSHALLKHRSTAGSMTPLYTGLCRSSAHETICSNSDSRMNLPSLYFSLGSYALSYFHPTVSPHCLHVMSRTMCLPVVMLRSIGSADLTLTTLANRKALPCWPRKFCNVTWLAQLPERRATVNKLRGVDEEV
jgi:hypothetical protein